MISISAWFPQSLVSWLNCERGYSYLTHDFCLISSFHSLGRLYYLKIFISYKSTSMPSKMSCLIWGDRVELSIYCFLSIIKISAFLFFYLLSCTCDTWLGRNNSFIAVMSTVCTCLGWCFSRFWVNKLLWYFFAVLDSCLAKPTGLSDSIPFDWFAIELFGESERSSISSSLSPFRLETL